jgi:hypothetical protein
MERHHESVIADLNKRLLDKYCNDTVLFEELVAVQNELGLLYGDRPTIPFLRPHFLTRTQYDSVMKAAETIAIAAESLTFAALEDTSLLDRLDVTDLERRLVAVDPGYSSVCASGRLDTFFDGDDFKFLEYNAETPSGPSDQHQIEAVLNRIPLLREFLSETPHWRPKPRSKLLETLIRCYREHGGKERKPNIAIVDWEGVSTEPEFYVLKDYFESMGYRTLVCDPSELEYEGEALHAGPFRVDILYKRVLIHELLEKYGANHPIVEAYEDGDLCMINSFRVKIAHKKMSFGIFSDEEYAGLFTDLQLETFRRHIPWTRKVEEAKTTFKGKTIDIPEFILKEKDTLLMKPNDDYGGAGITLGWEATYSDWETALAEALDGSFVVQEKAPVGKEEFPVYGSVAKLEALLVDFDPYLFNNKAEGGMVRLSASSLVNVTQGGGQTALVVLEDR